MDKDFVNRLSKWEKNSPQFKQLQTIKNIADMFQVVVGHLDEEKQEKRQVTSEVGALLLDMKEKLTSLESKEIDIPDYATPIVKAIKDAAKAHEKALKAVKLDPKVKVDVPKIDAPQVSVDAPDLSGVEKALKKELPKAFEKAIKLIPETQIPEADYTPLLEKWDEIAKQLESIDNATRMKSHPGTMKVTNPDGSSISGGSTTINAFSDSGGTTQKGLVDGDRHVQVDVLSSALPTGAATASNQQTDALTDAELRATAVPVSGTVTSTPSGTQNVDVTANTIGLATSANQVHKFAADRSGATKVNKALRAQTADVNLHTVTAGKTFKGIITLVARNTSNTSDSGIFVRDGSGGTILIPMTLGLDEVGQIAPTITQKYGTDAYPIEASTGIYLDLITTGLVVDIHAVGIEE